MIIRLLLILGLIPITIFSFFASALNLLSFTGVFHGSWPWGILFLGFFYLLVIELLYISHYKLKILFFLLIILPLYLLYPKSLYNESCVRKTPLNQTTNIWNTRTGIWEGRNIRFEIRHEEDNRYPKRYNIYELQTNELIKGGVEIDYDLHGKNNCAGLEIKSRPMLDYGHETIPGCIGVVIPKCALDEDYASKANGFYVSP